MLSKAEFARRGLEPILQLLPVLAPGGSLDPDPEPEEP